MAEPDALAGAVWRGDGGGFPAQLTTFVGADTPRVVRVLACPFGGEGEVACDGLAEVIRDFANEPPVELVAFTYGVGRRPFRSAIRVGDLLRVRCRASFACIEVDCMASFRLGISGQGLVDGVFQASGERFAVLLPGNGDGCLSRLTGRNLCLQGAAFLAECQRLAVQAG